MLAIAILAAGKGTRMKSALPKVLQPLAGKSLLERVLNCCDHLNPDRRLLVVGHKAAQVEQSLRKHENLEFILQKSPEGTGHAVQQLTGALSKFKGELLVLNGDVPLLLPNTIQKLLTSHRSNKADVTFITTRTNNAKGYGRVFANDDGRVNKIVEERDCTVKQLNNNLINSGVYCFNWEKLQDILPNLSNKNNQNELYITDTVAMLPLAMHFEIDDPREVSGVNNRCQLSECEAFLQERLRNHWMEEGVTFIDPLSCSISEECTFGLDVVIEPQTHLRGNCKIGNRCRLGPGSTLTETEIGDDVSILHSVITKAKISSKVEIGPFSHIRPETNISSNCRIGNFVEVKKSTIGEKSKINHLSYIGNATLGNLVNIGAGTITANYDGFNKHNTTIGEGTKTGANSVLVAPVDIGSSVTIGAGSTITKNVPDGALTIARAKQLTKNNWTKLKLNNI